MEFLLIKNGLVENAIVAEQEFIDSNAELQALYDQIIDSSKADLGAGPGWSFDGSIWKAPAPVLPEENPTPLVVADLVAAIAEKDPAEADALREKAAANFGLTLDELKALNSKVQAVLLADQLGYKLAPEKT